MRQSFEWPVRRGAVATVLSIRRKLNCETLESRELMSVSGGLEHHDAFNEPIACGGAPLAEPSQESRPTTPGNMDEFQPCGCPLCTGHFDEWLLSEGENSGDVYLPGESHDHDHDDHDEEFPHFHADDPYLPSDDQLADIANGGGDDGGSLPASNSVPALNSNLGATVDVFLDFDGHYQGTWGAYSNASTPAYDTDGNVNSFSSSELASIQQIWARVAEDFAPFNVNVTTVDSAGPRVHVAIGGSWTDWYGSSAGGVAYVSSFNGVSSATVYVFENDLGNGYAKYVAEASSHEAGHAFGLWHQSTYSGTTLTNTYNPGSGDWAPIMGNSYSRPITTWHDGTSYSSTTYQDDMSVIATQNSFGYRADDHGNNTAGATVLNVTGNAITGSGIIAQNSDVDYFSFTTGAGAVSLNVSEIAVGANLDAVLRLYSSSGSLIATHNPTASQGASINTNLAAGTYYLSVESNGMYGRVGQYTVSGTVATPDPNIAPVLQSISNQSMTTTDGSVQVSLVASDGDGDPITFSATSVVTSAQVAYDLDQQHEFYANSSIVGSNYYFNQRGYGEKFFLGNEGSSSWDWHFILPNGEVYAWTGTIGGSTLLDTVDPMYHADPSLLFNAQPAANFAPTLSIDQQADTLTITPQNGFTGSFQVTVYASDGVDQDQKTFTVDVTAPVVPNNVPVANNDAYAVDQGQTLSVAGNGVLVNDSDADSDPLTAVLVAGPSNGTLTLNSNGSFNYTPGGSYSGIDTFTYRANDGIDSSNVATVTITVNGNVAPVLQSISNQSMTTTDGSVQVSLVASDGDGDPITFSATSVVTSAQVAYDLDQQHEFYANSSIVGSNYYFNQRGYGEKFFLGNEGSSSWDWHFILPNGEVYAWTGTIGGSTLLDTVDPMYHADPSLLFNAQPAANFAPTLSIDQQADTLTITPQNGFTGSFQVTVYASDGTASVQQSFNVDVTTAANTVPVLQSISNQSMTTTDGSVQVSLVASDGDGDPITFSATSVVTSAQVAYDLDQQHEFYANSSIVGSNYYFNQRGYGEKFFLGNEGSSSWDWHFILPNGEVYAWTGTIGGSTLLDTVDPMYHADPSLLFNAQPAANFAPTLSIDQQADTLTITPQNGFTGSFQVTVYASDGTASVQQSFNVDVTTAANTVPVLQSISNQSMTTTDGSVQVSLVASDGDGDPITFSATSVVTSAQVAYDLDQQHEFYANSSIVGSNYYFNQRGYGEKFFLGNEGSSSWDWHFILPNGEVYAWTGTIGGSTLLDTVDPMYHADPSLLFNAQPAANFAPTLSIDQQADTLTITPQNGFTGSFQVTVYASDGTASVQQSFNVDVTTAANTVPVLQSISNQSMTTTDGSVQVSLVASDGDGDPITFSATSVVTSAQVAYDLDQQHEFYANSSIVGSNYYFNQRGYGEKFFLGNEGSSSWDWHFILPNGEVYAWTGTIGGSTLLDTVDPMYHADPSLLFNAQPAANFAPTLSIDQQADTLTITPQNGFTGSFQVTVYASDGTASVQQSFNVDVTTAAPTQQAPQDALPAAAAWLIDRMAQDRDVESRTNDIFDALENVFSEYGDI